MITLSGPPDSPATRYAAEWRGRLLAAWPEAANDPDAHIRLIAGARAPGTFGPLDLDLVIVGQWTPPHPLPPGPDETAPQAIASLIAVLTVQPQPPERVEWRGDHVGVRDPTGEQWTDSLERSREQGYALKAALGRHLSAAGAGGGHLSVAHLIWFAQVTEDAMLTRAAPAWRRDPDRERADLNSPLLRRNILYADAGWLTLLRKAGRHWPEQPAFRQTRILRAVPDASAPALATAATALLPPPPTPDPALPDGLIAPGPLPDLPPRAVLLYPTPPTDPAALFRLGYRLYQARGARVLILTPSREPAAQIARWGAALRLPDHYAAATLAARPISTYPTDLLHVFYHDTSPAADYITDYYDEYMPGAIDEIRRRGREAIDGVLRHNITLWWDYLLIADTPAVKAEDRALLEVVYGDRPWLPAPPADATPDSAV